MKSILGKFSMDIVSSCAFGVDPGSLDNLQGENDFITNAAGIFKRDRWDLVRRKVNSESRFAFLSLVRCTGKVGCCRVPSVTRDSFLSAESKATCLLFQFKVILSLVPGGVSLLNALKIPIFKPDETNFFGNIIKATLDHRKKTKERLETDDVH